MAGAHSVHETLAKRYRHLNFFQHECYLEVRVPRVRLPDGGIRQVEPDWAGKLSGFTLLFEALRDDRPMVRDAAANSISSLVFPHAFEPLRRIFEARDLPDPERAKAMALRAIGKINTVEAVEALCDRLREGNKQYVELALNALGELTNPELLPYLRHQIELVPPAYRAVLEDTTRRLERRMR